MDIRADIYSLGCTLFFLLTGQPPFRGTSVMQKILMHRETEPPALASLRPDIPPDLDALVQKMLAKNPAGWQEALSMVDKNAAGVVISVNGRVPDGEDLSWLWDVRFEHFGGPLTKTPVVAAGERGTDLAVRLGYAGVEHTLVHDTLAAIASCPPGPVEVVANYTAFLQLQRRLARHG